MMNFPQMATLFCLQKQKGDATSATNDLIDIVYGQVFAFVSDDATPKMVADQVVNILYHLNMIRSDVSIDGDALEEWRTKYTENTKSYDGLQITIF